MIFATGVHWKKHRPNRQKLSKNVRKLCFQPLWTIFGHFSDIFATFFGHVVDIPIFWPVQWFARYKIIYSEDAMGGWKKEGGGELTNDTPLKRGFWTPFSTPPRVSVLCFSCTEIHDSADQKLFWRGPEFFGRARSLVRFPPPPIRFAPPRSWPNIPFESKLLPAVLLLLRIYFPKIEVTVTVLKLGWIHLNTITVTVLASADSPLHFHWFRVTILKDIWIKLNWIPELPLPLPSWIVFEWER